MTMKPNVSMVTCLLALGVLAGSVTAQPADRNPPRDGQRDGPRGRLADRAGPVLRVSGQGEIQADPDAATVRLGALAQGQTAGEAQDQVNQVMQRALEAVKEAGIDEARIRTADLSLYPVYSQQQPPRPMDAEVANDEPRIVGYRASNVLVIELEDLTKAGAVIDAAINAGANQLQGIEFGLKNDLEARQEALTRAMRIARAKAQTLAEAAGMQLGEIAEIHEGGVNLVPPQPYRLGMAREMASTPVQPGQLTINAEVTVVYRLRPADGRSDRGDRPATRPQRSEE